MCFVVIIILITRRPLTLLAGDTFCCNLVELSRSNRTVLSVVVVVVVAAALQRPLLVVFENDKKNSE